MVKDHSDRERRNPLSSRHGLLLSIISKGYFICTIPHTGHHLSGPLLHQLWSIGLKEKWLYWSTRWDRSDKLPRHAWDLYHRDVALWYSVRSWCNGSSDRSFMVDPLSYFSIQPVFHDWCNKGHRGCYPVCEMVFITDPLLLIGKVGRKYFI